MVIAIYMFKCAAAQFLFGLFMAWRGRSTRSLHQDLAQLQHGVRTTIVYFYASHPDLPSAQTTLDGAGLQTDDSNTV